MAPNHSPIINLDNTSIEHLKILKYIEVYFVELGVYKFIILEN